jgi:hypothetical protein
VYSIVGFLFGDFEVFYTLENLEVHLLFKVKDRATSNQIPIQLCLFTFPSPSAHSFSSVLFFYETEAQRKFNFSIPSHHSLYRHRFYERVPCVAKPFYFTPTLCMHFGPCRGSTTESKFSHFLILFELFLMSFKVATMISPPKTIVSTTMTE